MIKFMKKHIGVSVLLVFASVGGLMAGVAFNSYTNETAPADSDEFIFWDNDAGSPNLKNITWNYLQSAFDFSKITTPELGGDLAQNGHDIDAGDDDCHTFGDSEDITVCFDGTDFNISMNSASDIDINFANSGAGNALLKADQISTAGMPVFDRVDSELYDTSTPHLLTLPELKNTTINTYNATPEAKEYDFPVANEGWMFMVSCSNTQNIVLDPNGSEQWYLNGVQGTAGQNIENTSCTKGEVVTCYSQQTGSSTYEVFCNSAYSDWTFE